MQHFILKLNKNLNIQLQIIDLEEISIINKAQKSIVCLNTPIHINRLVKILGVYKLSIYLLNINFLSIYLKLKNLFKYILHGIIECSILSNSRDSLNLYLKCNVLLYATQIKNSHFYFSTTKSTFFVINSGRNNNLNLATLKSSDNV